MPAASWAALSARRCIASGPRLAVLAGCGVGGTILTEAKGGRAGVTDALISHPQFGSLWLENVKIQGDHVVGEVEDDRIDGHRIMATMNFPRNCVRRWSDEHAPDCEVHQLGSCDCRGR